MGSVYTVGQINSYIKMMFSQDFLLNRVSVKGEISNCKYHGSGHIYFSLKDETGAISCVMFAGSRKNLSFRLENGQRVVAAGSVGVYERDGTYQLYVSQVQRDGLGALYERFEALKRELEEMGMFAPEYKQPIPRYVNTLGVVTAPEGAAVRDIINVAKRRHPGIRIILYPARVQGEGAAGSVARGIRVLDRLGPDVIIVGRGGGSIEDLWAFNEEEVARAIFECRTPVISAVGHETDTTITDFVADLRAPTPSAAAELAVYEYREVREYMLSCGQRMRRAVRIKADAQRARLKQMELRLKFAHPRQKLNEKRQYSAELEDRLRSLMDRRLTAEKHRLALYIEKMKGLSPLEKLNQGFSFVQDRDGRNVKSIRQAQPGDTLTVYVTDGKIETEVITAAGAEYPAAEELPESGV